MMDRPYWQQVGMRNSDVIKLLEKQEELVFEPGSKYGYSNSGYTILAIIIEEVTGESFNDYSDAFFQKMGMSNTSFLRRYMGVIPNRADSYSDWGDGLWLSTPVVTRFSGDGFLYTTLRDQLHYEQAVQNARSENNTLLMESQKPIPNSEITDYGFGLQLEGRMGRAAQYHSGSTFGYNSHTTRFPEENLTVFVMSNNMSIWSGNVADRVASFLLPDGGNMEYNSRINQSVRVPDTDQILGQYISPDGFLIRIVEEEGTLTWINESNYPYEIVREDDNLFAVGFNTNIKVGFYNDEVVEFYRDGTTVSYTKSEYVAASQADVAAFVGEYHSQELDVSFEIKMNEDNKLIFALPDWEREIELVNRNELRASDYILKVQRDQFDRPTDILVTLNFRAPNNRFKKVTNLVFQPQIPTDNGSIQVSTVGSVHGDASDILLTANYPNGNEIWFKQFGGNSYDKASSIIDVEDGYLIIGSTSSYGNGNYDMFVIKTDKEGNKIWQNTYGNLYNEYGYIAEAIEHGYLIKGTIQNCTSNSDVFNRDCTTNVWVVSVDENGNEISNEILEEIDRTQ
ncbi:MAG: serine hydrolase [Bacteroidota bacterium]